MWCCQCQQDVPAARAASGPPSCPRCKTLLPPRRDSVVAATSITDCGLELDSFTRATRPLPSVRQRLALEHRGAELRRLERMLRSTIRRDRGNGPTALRELARPFDEPGDDMSVVLRPSAAILRRPPRAATPSPAWGISLLLAAGGTALVCGLLLLVAANMRLHAGAWRWGFATTIAGQGLLIGGLAAMAARLWRNSRRLNSQLEVLDRRLVDVQRTVASTSPAPFSLRIERADHTPLVLT